MQYVQKYHRLVWVKIEMKQKWKLKIMNLPWHFYCIVVEEPFNHIQIYFVSSNDT
jgi:hypothetical protein